MPRGDDDVLARRIPRQVRRMVEVVERRIVERAAELAPILASLQAGGPAADFRASVDKWSRKPGYTGFNSPNGQMFLNQLVGAASDDEVATVIGAVNETAAVLPVPVTCTELSIASIRLS